MSGKDNPGGSRIENGNKIFRKSKQTGLAGIKAYVRATIGTEHAKTGDTNYGSLPEPKKNKCTSPCEQKEGSGD